MQLNVAISMYGAVGAGMPALPSSADPPPDGGPKADEAADTVQAAAGSDPSPAPAALLNASQIPLPPVAAIAATAAAASTSAAPESNGPLDAVFFRLRSLESHSMGLQARNEELESEVRVFLLALTNPGPMAEGPAEAHVQRMAHTCAPILLFSALQLRAPAAPYSILQP